MTEHFSWKFSTKKLKEFFSQMFTEIFSLNFFLFSLEPSISWLSSSSKLSTISTAIAPKHISNENIFNNNQSDFYQMPFNDQQQQEKIKSSSSSSTTLNKLWYVYKKNQFE